MSLAQAAQHALLIGVSDYTASGLSNLPGARNDLARMETVLKQRFGFDGKRDSITTLLDAQATHRRIARAFATLRETVRAGDQVFVYYSGHGSQARDLNDDEPFGWDQTWVSYGARSAQAEGLDRYDVLDDQIYDWLGQIGTKTGEMVVFVSDSCHSGTVSRGDVTVRAAPPADAPDHPLARDPYPAHSQAQILSIGAARDDQPAIEMPFDAAGRHGLFTWYWSQSLARAEPTETWQQIFDRARAWMELRYRGAQQPQLSGAGKDGAILGGQFPARRDLVLVKQVTDRRVTLEVGQLTGATVGSIYESVREETPARVTLTRVYPHFSLGTLEAGALEAGEFLRETHRAFSGSTVRVYVGGDAPAEQEELLGRLRALFPAPNESAAAGQLAGFERTDRQDHAQLIVYALQPRRDDQGALVYARTPGGQEVLPVRDPEADLEVWVLGPNERPLHERLRVGFADREAGLRVLRANLTRYRRTLALMELAESQAASGTIQAQVVIHERCAPQQDGCFAIGTSDLPAAPEERLWYRRDGRPIAMRAAAEHPWRLFDLLSFRFANEGHREAYVYLYVLRDDGSVAALYPNAALHADGARLPGRSVLDTAKAANNIVFLLIDQPGEFAWFTVVSRYGLNSFQVLEQEAYEAVRSRGTPLAPLEQLLIDTTHGTRGQRVGIKTDEWSAQLTRYTVAAPAP